MAAKSDDRTRVVAHNRKARFNYEIGETFEAGIALTGTEVKALRQGKATIARILCGRSRQRDLAGQRQYPGISARRPLQSCAQARPQAPASPSPDQQADGRGRARRHDARAAQALFQRQGPRQARACAGARARSSTTSAKPRKSAAGSASAAGCCGPRAEARSGSPDIPANTRAFARSFDGLLHAHEHVNAARAKGARALHPHRCRPRSWSHRPRLLRASSRQTRIHSQRERPPCSER